MCGYHILFIPSSVDGHLGCFHVLAVLEWTLGYMYLFELWCSLGIHSGVGLTDHIYGHSTSSFLRNLHTVLCSGAQIYIPINNVWVFPFLYMLSNIYYLQTFFFLLQQCFIRVARNWTHISKVCLCIHFKKSYWKIQIKGQDLSGHLSGLVNEFLLLLRAKGPSSQPLLHWPCPLTWVFPWWWYSS